MNILNIIGNGFDINLGLKTRYSDFYKYYQSQASQEASIIKLKAEIANGIHNWSDLELALGQYTKKLSGLNEVDVIYEDLVDNLCDYLIQEEDAFDFTKVEKDKFKKQLYTPEVYLTDGDANEIASFQRAWGAANWNINIITLNYTLAIEKILGNKVTHFHIGNHQMGKVIFGNIQHIHGYTNKRTIMGVNDISQIANLKFHNNTEILETLLKPTSNRIQRHNIDTACEKYIQEADQICIFGTSLGDTDNHWWKLIGEQLKRRFKLIIFQKGESINERFGHKPARTQRAIKKLFLAKTDLNDDEMEESLKNIYVGINTDMFDIT